MKRRGWRTRLMHIISNPFKARFNSALIIDDPHSRAMYDNIINKVVIIIIAAIVEHDLVRILAHIYFIVLKHKQYSLSVLTLVHAALAPHHHRREC